jgi:hypothetical protein
VRRKKYSSQIAIFLTAACLVPLFVIFKNDISALDKKELLALPLLELKEFRYKELLRDGSGVEVLGSVGYHFKDRDEISNFKIFKKDTNYTMTVLSKSAVKRGDEIAMTGGVSVVRSDGYKLSTEKARYLQSSKVVKIDSFFRFEGTKFVAFGDSSDVDIKNKKIGVNSIRAKLNY